MSYAAEDRWVAEILRGEMVFFGGIGVRIFGLVGGLVVCQESLDILGG